MDIPYNNLFDYWGNTFRVTYDVEVLIPIEVEEVSWKKTQSSTTKKTHKLFRKS